MSSTLPPPDEADTLEEILGRAHRYMDTAGYPPRRHTATLPPATPPAIITNTTTPKDR